MGSIQIAQRKTLDVSKHTQFDGVIETHFSVGSEDNYGTHYVQVISMGCGYEDIKPINIIRILDFCGFFLSELRQLIRKCKCLYLIALSATGPLLYKRRR